MSKKRKKCFNTELHLDHLEIFHTSVQNRNLQISIDQYRPSIITNTDLLSLRIPTAQGVSTLNPGWVFFIRNIGPGVHFFNTALPENERKESRYFIWARKCTSDDCFIVQKLHKQWKSMIQADLDALKYRMNEIVNAYGAFTMIHEVRGSIVPIEYTVRIDTTPFNWRHMNRDYYMFDIYIHIDTSTQYDAYKRVYEESGAKLAPASTYSLLGTPTGHSDVIKQLVLFAIFGKSPHPDYIREFVQTTEFDVGDYSEQEQAEKLFFEQICPLGPFKDICASIVPTMYYALPFYPS